MSEPKSPGCGCGGTTNEPSPIVCTLGATEQPSRASEFRRAFAHLVATETSPRGFRWRFEHAQGLEEQLIELARREHDCCRFFDFHVFRADDAIVWETRADEEASAILEEFMRLPDTLSTAGDVAGLKQIFERVGLAFTSDADEKAK